MKLPIRLIASDLDGTLIPEEGEGARPSDRVFDQILRLKRAGIPFVAASGRQYQSLTQLFAPIRDEIYYLCENGGNLYYQDKPLFSDPMDPQVSRDIIRDIVAQPGCEVLINGLYHGYVIPKGEYIVHLMRDIKHYDLKIIEDADEIREDILKIAVCVDGGTARMEDYFTSRWADKVNVSVAGTRWIDFGDANKGRGIRAACDVLGVRPEEVMAFGDNYNDLAMLETVGHPYIMASSAPELRKRFPNCASVEDVLEELLRQVEG